MAKFIVGIFLGGFFTYALYQIGSHLVRSGRQLEKKEQNEKK